MRELKRSLLSLSSNCNVASRCASVCASTCSRYEQLKSRTLTAKPEHRDTSHCNCLSALPFVYLPFVYMDLAKKNLLQPAAVKVADLLRIFKILLASSPQLSSAFSGCSSSARAPRTLATHFVLRDIPCATRPIQYDPERTPLIKIPILIALASRFFRSLFVPQFFAF